MEYNSTPKPAYWAVLPAAVRYDKKLSSTAKLLYAELSALSNFAGFCYAGNEHLAGLYKVDVRTIKRILQQLSDKGYIRIEIHRDEKSNAILWRKIYCGINPLASINVSASGGIQQDINVQTSGQKCPYPLDKNVHPNNINNIYMPPIVPLEGERKKTKRKELTPWKRERFEGFWKLYPRKTNKQAAIRAWDKLQASDELLAEIGVKLLLLIKNSPDWRDKKYIPHASTFLNNARWNDVENLADASSGQAPATGQSSGWAEDPEVM